MRQFKKNEKNKIISKFREFGAIFPYLGIEGPKHINKSNLSLHEEKPVKFTKLT